MVSRLYQYQEINCTINCTIESYLINCTINCTIELYLINCTVQLIVQYRIIVWLQIIIAIIDCYGSLSVQLIDN